MAFADAFECVEEMPAVQRGGNVGRHAAGEIDAAGRAIVKRDIAGKSTEPGGHQLKSSNSSGVVRGEAGLGDLGRRHLYRRPPAFADQLRATHPRGSVLIAGHSDTVPGIVAALCACDVAPMPDHEYDRLSIVHINAAGHPRLDVQRYGAASPTP